jgi:cephalosporin hydroxylase
MKVLERTPNKFYLLILFSYFCGVLTYHLFTIHKQFTTIQSYNKLFYQNDAITSTQQTHVKSNPPPLTISNCNNLFAETTDELSNYHPDIKNRKIKLYKDKEIIVDDILYGYDVLFEKTQRFALSKWLGVQCQQDPSDAFLIQMLLWQIKPDLIIDLGGSALFFASIMNYYNQTGKIITIDIKDFDKNWINLCKDCSNPAESSLWKQYVTFYKGYTTDPKILATVEKYVNQSEVVFINQDASHYGDDVYQDLVAYSKFESVGSYIIAQDTKLDRINRRKTINSNIEKFISENNNFIINREVETQFYYTQHAKGYLKRIK